MGTTALGASMGGALVNYDKPRQLADKSGWHYTRLNDRRVWVIGYCCDHLDQPHATADAARECYTRYLLDHDLQLDGMSYVDTRKRCEAVIDSERCEQWTEKFADFRPWGPSYTLCDAHRTREVVAVLFGQAGDSVHS
jgi:hypothetical protein